MFMCYAIKLKFDAAVWYSLNNDIAALAGALASCKNKSNYRVTIRYKKY